MPTRNVGAFMHRHSNSGPPFFLIWSLPRLCYGSLSGSISLNHLSIFYNISCYNSLVLLTFVYRSSCHKYLYIHKGMKQSSKCKEGILASTRIKKNISFNKNTVILAKFLKNKHEKYTSE